MSEVKWIKITTDMFSNYKIRHLRKLPDGDRIVLVWVMLLTLAGRCNSGGMIFLSENIPYTPKLLADELDIEESVITLALDALERFGMIRRDKFLYIDAWCEYQNTARLEEIREQNRIRKQRQRERERALPENATVTVTGQDRDSHVLDIETEKEKEEELDKEEDIASDEKIQYQAIADMFNRICKSYPKVTKLSEKRRAAIRARLRDYTVADFKAVFENAEASSFLKGGNGRDWSANFDWLIRDTNMAKVLDGNYDDKGGKGNGRGSCEVHGGGAEERWHLRADVE